MKLSDMNQLTTLGDGASYIGENYISVYAGDASQAGNLPFAFQGIIGHAFPDGALQPQVGFVLRATPTAWIDAQNSTPTSVNGSADVAQLMSQLASQAGLQFENNSVSVKIRNPYLYGSIGNQIRDLARWAGIEHVIDRGTLAIWNPGQARGSNEILISTQTGMKGYPSFNQKQIFVTTLYNPALTNGVRIRVQSEFTAACGLWSVNHAFHDLESNVPKGKWFSTVKANRIGDGATASAG